MNKQRRSTSSPYVRASITDFYDATLDFIRRKDLPFFVGMARRTGGPVLDIASGTGRILIPLARAGFEVTGLDFAPRMLAICRRKLAQEPKQVRDRSRLMRADMRQFRLHRRFRLALVPYYSFQFLRTISDQLECLESIRRHLLPGGRLVLDLFNPAVPRMMEKRNRTFGRLGPHFKMADGRFVTRRMRFSSIDMHRQILEIESVSNVRHPGGRRERLTDRLQMRFLYRFEVEHLLARAGFRIEKIYGDFDKSAFAADKSESLIIAANT